MLSRKESVADYQSESDARTVQILIYGDMKDSETTLDIALSMLPHRVYRATALGELIDLCQQCPPNALIVGISNLNSSPLPQIRKLRSALPNLPIYALRTRADPIPDSDYFDHGADAVLDRNLENIPVMHNLVGRTRRDKGWVDWPANRPILNLPFPWSVCNTVGAMICNDQGTIVDMNRRLAQWLGISDPRVLVGSSTRCYPLSLTHYWREWIDISMGLNKFVNGSWYIRGPGGQIVSMLLDTFAVAGKPRYSCLSLLDETGITALGSKTGK